MCWSPMRMALRSSRRWAHLPFKMDWKRQQKLLEQAKPYTVSLYQYQKKLLEKQHGLIAYLDGSVLVLSPEFYHRETGLTLESGNLELLEV